MKLIQTKDYLLLIDEEAEINKKDIFINTLDGSLNKANDWIYISTCKKVIAYHPLTKEAKELDLPLLPNPFENNNEIGGKEFNEQLWEDYRKPLNRSMSHLEREAFIEGYKTAQSKSKQFSLDEIEKKADVFARERFQNSDKTDFLSNKRNLINFTNQIIQSLSTKQIPKQFSLEDIITFGKKCFYKGFDKSENDDANSFTAWREECSKLIQSLSTQQLPVSFEPEYDIVHTDHAPNGFEKVLKFKTNSEGKEEIQGRYVY